MFLIYRWFKERWRCLSSCWCINPNENCIPAEDDIDLYYWADPIHLALITEIVIFTDAPSGEVDDFFIFRLLKFICYCWLNFSIFFLFLIKYFHIMFIIIVFWVGCDRPSRLLFFVPDFLLTFFVCFFILFPSCCSHAWVFGKILMQEFPISYCHT